MNKIFSVIILSLLLANSVSGQNDPKAISILDKFSSKAASAPSVSMKFLFIRNDQVRKSVDTVAGSVVLSGDSYKLDLPDNIIWYNGVISWSYLPAEDEVTIMEPDRKDKSFENRPSLIFTMYKDGYKCRLLEEKSDSYLIDLYPADIKSEIIRVRLSIAKPSLDLKGFEYKMRDGVVITLEVTEYSLARTISDGFFEFDPSKHKGVDVIDMR
jgi:outer membrane lipoprotein-sorting protein